jgi:diamine N-acetyltransferase
MSLECLIDYCFKTLRLNQLYCNIMTDNCESISLFKNLGFAEIGIKKQWISTPSGYADEMMLQLIAGS